MTIELVKILEQALSYYNSFIHHDDLAQETFDEEMCTIYQHRASEDYAAYHATLECYYVLTGKNLLTKFDVLEELAQA